MKKDNKLKREIKKYNFENRIEIEKFVRKKQQTQLILLISSIALMSIAAFSGFMEYALDVLIESFVKLFK